MLQRTLLFAMLLALPGCSIDLGTILPSSSPEPVRPCAEADAWRISGFLATDVVTGGGAPPAVGMVVGESREVLATPERSSAFTGCEAVTASVRWISTSPAVAAFGPGTSRVWLTAASAGDTDVRAEVTLTNGRVHVARISASVVGGVDRIHVSLPESPTAGRTVILSGSVPLAASPSGGTDARLPFEVRSAGTLDMVVDWQTPGNRVFALVCPGAVVPPPLGCAPVIDGTRASGKKPLTGRATVTSGAYWLLISNGGPGEEVIRYEAGLVPN